MYWPYIECWQIAQKKDLAVYGSHFEIINDWPTGIQITFIPAIHDLLNLPLASLISKSNRALIELVTAAAFNLDLFVIHINRIFPGHRLPSDKDWPLIPIHPAKHSVLFLMKNQMTADSFKKNAVIS